MYVMSNPKHTLPGKVDSYLAVLNRLYERSGFRRIAGPMGATGHGGCNAFYLLDL